LPGTSTSITKRLILALAGTIFITACSVQGPSQSPTGNNHVYAQGSATITLIPQVKAGTYRAQALVSAYTKANINHLVVKVFQLNGTIELPVLDGNGNQVMADLANSELDSPLTFTNLFRNTTYRVRCYAYKAPGEAAGDFISTTDANSYVDVQVLDDDRPVMSALKVKLIDTVFNGEGTTGVEVTDGAIVSNGAVSIGKTSTLISMGGTAYGSPYLPYDAYYGTGSYGPEAVFDGDLNTTYATWVNGAAYLDYVLPQPQAAQKLRIRTVHDYDEVGSLHRGLGDCRLKSFKLQGSNDGGASFTDIYSGNMNNPVLVTGTEASDWQAFAFSNTVAYGTYRLLLLSSEGNVYVAVNEMQLYK